MPVKLNRFAPCVVLASLSIISVLAHAAERDARVLHYESVAIDFQASQASAPTKSSLSSTKPGARTMRFAAFGNSYKVELEPNTRIGLPAGTRAQAYRGVIDGRRNSWVRVTRVGATVHGMLFDGKDLFAIEPTTAIAADAESGTAIFRLADTQTELGAGFCSVAESPNASGLQVYQALGTESKLLLTQMQQAGAQMRLEMSALMDSAFRERYASDSAASDAIIARVNNVDGIFSSQVGVEITVTQIIPTDASSSSPDALLQAVSRLRSSSPTLYSAGTTHLFTGSDLDGSTVGIAYIDTLCSQQYAVSLSEARDRGAWFDSLVAAHEIGHSFGSPHDGQGQCAATPATTFLMAPSITGSDRFSQCSVDIMQARVQTASCLVPIPLPDISLATPATYRVAQNQTFVWSIAASNIGSVASAGSQVQITVPAALSMGGATVSGGNCSTGAGTLTCDLGTLASQETRTIQVTLNGSLSGVYSVAATASATKDFTTANNSTSTTVRVDPSVDVSVSIAAPDSAAIDQPMNATFSVANKSNAAAPNLEMSIVVPPGLTISGAAQLGSVACQIQFQIIRCSLAALAASSTVSGMLTVTPHDAGAQMITAAVDGAYIDPQPQDNTAQKSVMISGAPISAPATTPVLAEKSGGGAIGVYLLSILSALAYRRRRGPAEV